MNDKLKAVLTHEGVVTIVTINAQPSSIVNTWMSYLTVTDDYILAPAAGMRSIEHDFETDNTVTVTLGTKEVEGTQGPGAGFHIHGHGSFLDSGEEFDAKKAQFPWVRKVLKISIDDVEQKI